MSCALSGSCCGPGVFGLSVVAACTGVFCFALFCCHTVGGWGLKVGCNKGLKIAGAWCGMVEVGSAFCRLERRFRGWKLSFTTVGHLSWELRKEA